METLLWLTKTLLASVVLLAILFIGLSVLLYHVAMKRLQDRLTGLALRVNESLEAGVKLLEVRQFYEEAHGEYQRMLNEAHRDGDRQRQDRMRRLIERLDALKARALDRTTRLLDDEAERPPRRRRRPRRGRQPGGGQNPPPAPPGPANPDKT